MTVITTLNPIIRGWAAYYRSAVSKEVFTTVDHHLRQLTYRWALRAHPNKSKRWVVDRYFGEFNPSRRNRWVFGDRESGAYLRQLDWTKIVRHTMVPGTASPDDPALAECWAERRRKRPLPVSTPIRRLLQAQDGRCTVCGELLLAADHEPRSPHEWEQWIKTTRKALRVRAHHLAGGRPSHETGHRHHKSPPAHPVRSTSDANAAGESLAEPCDVFRTCLSRMRLAPHVRF